MQVQKEQLGSNYCVCCNIIKLTNYTKENGSKKSIHAPCDLHTYKSMTYTFLSRNLFIFVLATYIRFSRSCMCTYICIIHANFNWSNPMYTKFSDFVTNLWVYRWPTLYMLIQLGWADTRLSYTWGKGHGRVQR